IGAMRPVWCFFGGEGTAVLALAPSAQEIEIEGRSYLAVLVPTAPVPFGGALIYVPHDWVRPATLEWTSCGGGKARCGHAPATTRRPGSRGPPKSATLIPLASGGCAARASRAFCRWKSLTAHRGEEPSAIRWRRFAAIRPDATRGRGRDPPTRASRGRPALWPSASVVERYLPVSFRVRSCVLRRAVSKPLQGP